MPVKAEKWNSVTWQEFVCLKLGDEVGYVSEDESVRAHAEILLPVQTDTMARISITEVIFCSNEKEVSKGEIIEASFEELYLIEPF